MQASGLRRYTSVLLLLVIALLAGCSSPQYSRDFKPDTGFQNYQTYSWRQASSDVAGVNQERIQSLINHQLSRQGLRQSDQEPDFLVDLHIFLQTAAAPSTGIGIGIGLPVGRHGSIGLGSSQLLNRSKQVSVIVVDFTDSLNNSLLWRGSANNIPVKNLAPENNDQLAKILEKLLIQYPPQ